MHSTLIKAILTVALGCVVGGRPARAQALSFLRQLTGSPAPEYATGIVRDPTGVYVVSIYPVSSSVAGGTAYSIDGLVRKYNANGTENWTRQIGGQVFPGGVAVDGLSLYVAARRAFAPDVLLRRYDSDGNELWTRQFGTDISTVYGLAVDPTGVYIPGRFGTPSGPGEPFLRKYSLTGDEQWTRNLSSNFSNASAFAIDATGAYLAGNIAPSNGSACCFTSFLRKYDIEGAEIWSRQFDSDVYVSALVANAGGIYAAGRLHVTPPPGEGFLRKYDGAGNELWTRQFRNDGGIGLAVDASGIYVAGAANGALPGHCSAGAEDQFVRRYDLDGNELWSSGFGTYGQDLAAGIAVDSNNIYVAGNRILGQYGQRVSPSLAKLEKNSAAIAPSKPRIRPGCVINAASLLGGGVAPGEIVTILGTAMGPAQAVSANLSGAGKVPTLLAETRVLFDGVAAPLLSVSDQQATAIVPRAIAGSPSVEVAIEYKGVRSEAVTLPVLGSRPGIFSLDKSGAGQAAVLNQDGTLNSSRTPAEHGSIIAIYGTGGGQTEGLVAEDQIQGNPPARINSPVWVILNPLFDDYIDDGYFPDVVYAGGVAGSVGGLLQINVKLPDYLPAGTWSVRLGTGGDPYAPVSQSGVTIEVN